jgi:hypothetical protein
MMADSKLVRAALNTPYTEWQSIENLLSQTNDAHTKEVLRRFMYVKRNRMKEDGNRIVGTKEHCEGGSRRGC